MYVGKAMLSVPTKVGPQRGAESAHPSPPQTLRLLLFALQAHQGHAFFPPPPPRLCSRSSTRGYLCLTDRTDSAKSQLLDFPSYLRDISPQLSLVLSLPSQRRTFPSPPPSKINGSICTLVLRTELIQFSPSCSLHSQKYAQVSSLS